MVQFFCAHLARVSGRQDIGAASVGRRLKARGDLVRWTFVGLVLVPTLATLVHTGWLASPRYVPQAQFVVRAKGFRADDAKKLAIAVTKHADAFIANLNDRAHDDQLRYAEAIVDKAREKLAEAETRLTTFRNAHGLVNPAEESLALKTITRFSERQALGRQIALTPSSPAIESVGKGIQSYKDEIAKLRARVVGADNIRFVATLYQREVGQVIGDQRFRRKCNDAMFIQSDRFAMTFFNQNAPTVHGHYNKIAVLKSEQSHVYDDVDYAISTIESL